MDEMQEMTREEKIERYREQKEAEKKSLKRKRIIKVIVVLLIVCLLLALWENRQKILPENAYEKLQFALADSESGNGYPVALKGNSDLNCGFVCTSGYAAVLTDSSFQVLNAKGNAVIETQNGYSDPALAAGETRYLVYELGGYQYKIEGISGMVREDTAEQKILAADISEKGKYMLATASASHVSELSVYKADGSLQYNYKFSSCYITDISISSDGLMGAVCGVYNENGEIYSELYLFDFGSPEPLTVCKRENSVFMDVDFGHDGIVAIGSKEAVFMSTDGKTVNAYSYGEASLISYDIYNGSAALALSSPKNPSGAEILILDSSGEKTAGAENSTQVRDLSFYGDVIAVLSEAEITMFSTVDGSEITRLETELNAVRIELCDVNSIYIMELSDIDYRKF